MSPLKNIRHEKFCQGIVSGLSQTKAYTAAGYSERGAKQSAARLLNNPDVRSRVSELQQEIESSFVRLQITERLQRLEAIQDRWDALREAKRCFAKGDFEGAMKTGVVCRKKRWIGGKDGYEVIEYEISTALIEALNSIEKRAAIETGQEVDRTDISLRGGVAAQAEILRKAFTLDELEAMDAKIEAAKAAGTPKLIEAPAKPSAKKEDSSSELASEESSPGRATLVNGNSSLGGEKHVNGNGHKESWRE
jgi:hypothetical protein